MFKKKVQIVVCILFHISEKCARSKMKGACVKERGASRGVHFTSNEPGPT